ncbi:hypothetical protein BD408DRAFT_414142 [Parasitella parasitica]|nr:hypothetical protein BD408DRAFT_414142 [Parasitella parasitica]
MHLIPLFLAVLIAIVNAVPQDAVITSNAAPVQPSSVAAPVASATQPPAASGSVAISASQQPIATGILSGGTSNATQSGVVNSGAANNNTLDALPTSASYGNSVYPGAASFVTPTASKSVSPLYRIDSRENVTFVWSFTDLRVQPANLTLAAVAPNKVTYTITAMPGLATSAVWQIKDVPAASPLMMGMYQIQLYDQRGVSAPAQPGWLAPYTRLSIAFYSPESYSAMSGSDYCPTCFYNAGKRISESFGPIAVALSVATATSVMILYGILC